MSSNTIVIDIGASNARFGYAGDDLPSLILPTSAASSQPQQSDSSAAASATASDSKRQRISESSQSKYAFNGHQPNDEIINIIDGNNGRITNWDVYGSLIDYASRSSPLLGNLIGSGFSTSSSSSLQSNPNAFGGNAIIVTESVLDDTDISRGRISELMFERYGASSMFFSRTAPLACYANARTTGLVLDLGGGQFTSSPVHDGHLLREDVNTSELGGNMIDAMVLQSLQRNYLTTTTSSSSSSKQKKSLILDFECRTTSSGTREVIDPPPFATQSFRRFARMGVCRRIKESCLFFDEPSKEAQERTFTLPDGTEIVCDKIRKDICDILFNSSAETSDKVVRPLHALVFESALGSEDMLDTLENSTEFRRKLLENIIICGGMSVVEGLPEQLVREIKSVAQHGDQPRVIKGPASHRQHSPWIGGSILGSLSTFPDMCATKKQYEEEGKVAAVLSRCP